MNIKISKPKFKIRELILALVFIVPYTEISLIRENFGFERNGVIIPASIFIMMTISIILSRMMILSNKSKVTSKLRKMVYISLLLHLMIFMEGLFIGNFTGFFTQFLWFAVPFYYAYIIIKYIDKFKLSSINIGIIGLIYFAIYIFVSILINSKNYGFALTGDLVQSRLISPGGGPVILGYTIVLAASYLIIVRKSISKTLLYTISVVYLVGVIFTGSRGAIWPFIVLLFILIIAKKKTLVNILFVIFIGIVIIIANPISLVFDIVPRIMDLSGGLRVETFFNALNIFANQSISTMLFGSGLSNCFPYQEWLTNRGGMDLLSYNTFFYKNEILLVQPHNTFIYLLLETGLIGLMIFLNIFYNSFKILKMHTNKEKVRYLVLLFILALNFLDSIFMIQPGTAGLWWILLFLSLHDKKDKKQDQIDSYVKNKI